MCNHSENLNYMKESIFSSAIKEGEQSAFVGEFCVQFFIMA